MSFGKPPQPFGTPIQPFGSPNHSKPYAHPGDYFPQLGHPNYPGGPFHPGQYPHPGQPHSFDTPGYGQSIMPGSGFTGTGHQEATYVYPRLTALIDCRLAWSISDGSGILPKVAVIPSVRILADAANRDLPMLVHQIKNSETEDDETQDSLYTELMNELHKALVLVRSSYYLEEIGKSKDSNFSDAVTPHDLYTYRVSRIIVNLFKLIALQSTDDGSAPVDAGDLIRQFLHSGWGESPSSGPRFVRITFSKEGREYTPLCAEAIDAIFGYEGGPLAEYPKLVRITLSDDPVPMHMSHCVLGVLSELKELWDASSVASMVDKLGDLFWFSVNLARLADPEFSLRNSVSPHQPNHYLDQPDPALAHRLTHIFMILGEVAALVKSRVHCGVEWSKDDAFHLSCRTKSIVKEISDLLPIVSQYMNEPGTYTPQPGLTVPDVLARNLLKLRKQSPDLEATENQDTESDAVEEVFGQEGDPRAEYPNLVSVTLAKEPVATQMSHCVHGVLSGLKELWDAAAPSGMTDKPDDTLPSAMVDKLDATTHLVLVDKLGDLLQFSVNLARLADPEFSLQNYSDRHSPGRFFGRPSEALRSRISRISFTLEDIAELVKSRTDGGKAWSRDEASTATLRAKKVVDEIINLLPIIRQYTIIPLSYNRQPRLELSDVLARNILKLRKHYPDLGATQNHTPESEASDLNLE